MEGGTDIYVELKKEGMLTSYDGGLNLKV